MIGPEQYHLTLALTKLFTVVMTKRKRSSKSATVIIDDVDYMKSYPEQMLQTADVHLIVDGCSLPVHSFVLMASSPFFSEFVTASVNKSPNYATQTPMEIPIEGIVKEGVRYALFHLYQDMQPGRWVQTTLGCTADAEHVAKFGHKFQVQVLQDAADEFLEDWLSTEGFELMVTAIKDLNEGPQPKAYEAVPVTAIHGAATKVIDWALFAEQFDLPYTLECCAKWLAENCCEVAAVHKALSRLSSKTIMRVMWGCQNFLLLTGISQTIVMELQML